MVIFHFASRWNQESHFNKRSSNPVPLPDLYFDSFSYPVASIFFGDMAIVSLFLLADPVWKGTGSLQ